MIAIDKNDPPYKLDEVKAAFMRRSDIMALPPENRESAWRHKKILIERFWSHFNDTMAPEWEI